MFLLNVFFVRQTGKRVMYEGCPYRWYQLFVVDSVVSGVAVVVVVVVDVVLIVGSHRRWFL